jgi:hypothetical protein
MSELDFSIDDGAVSINGKVVDLPYPVAEALTVGELVIVRVEPTIGEVFNSNVYGFKADSSCKWQIAESPHGTEADKPFTSISVSPDNQLVAGNWNGVDYLVDLMNGAISTVSFNK